MTERELSCRYSLQVRRPIHHHPHSSLHQAEQEGCHHQYRRIWLHRPHRREWLEQRHRRLQHQWAHLCLYAVDLLTSPCHCRQPLLQQSGPAALALSVFDHRPQLWQFPSRDELGNSHCAQVVVQSDFAARCSLGSLACTHVAQSRMDVCRAVSVRIRARELGFQPVLSRLASIRAAWSWPLS